MRDKTVSILSAVLLSVLSFAVIELGAYLGYRSAMADEIVMPADPSISLRAALSNSVLAAIPVLVYHEPDSEVIAGLRTYGQEQPLTEAELNGLVVFLNLDPLPMEEDAYYITFLASATAYRDFLQDYGESLQSFLLRHVAWMDREIRFADPPVAGGLVARRLIVIEDGIWNSDSEERGIDYRAHGLTDSDGSWSFIDSYCPSCAFYSPDLGLDFGLMHEWIHAIFKLPDHYALDFHFQLDINGVLAGVVPESWQFYSAGGRPDISNRDFAMGGNGTVLRHYSALQLAERRVLGIVHDKERALADFGFFGQVPAEVVWDLGPDLADAPILVYQSQPCPPDNPNSAAYACKVLGPVPIFHGRLDERGRIGVGNLFADYEGAVIQKEGVLFVRALVGDEYRFRWLDIRDFTLAIWEGFGESVVMRFNLASADTNPEDFVWTVSYESLDP